MQVVLVMFRADGERRSFSVVRDITVLGRREDCDLRIPLGDISRKHCRIIRSADSVRIEDLGSSNGTLVNGERITSVELQPGDTVAVGPVTFVVQIDGVPAEESLQPYAHNREPVAQDTAVAAAAVGVGSLTEVEPPALADVDEVEELEEIEEDFGAAPLIASVDDGADDAEAVAALEPVADTSDLEPLDELEPIEELEEVEEVTEAQPVSKVAAVDDEGELQPNEDLAHLDDDEALSEPEPPPARPATRAAQPAAAASPFASAPPPPPAPPAFTSSKATAATAASSFDEPESLAEPIEGELQSSDVFDGVNGSNFDIVVDDDAADRSEAGDIEIDWNAESNTGSK